ncbi:hypothetical protein S1361_25095 [Streptomyces cyanogenus]|uniref:Uncharacterized protein n=1 Tax=Streptomyces cyanogenus TaxID=80860 RepID=A0ABX7TWG7_STRCY|nr:hypothetical protein S1361_25095 [Streptomyces cyanogenus]
MAGWKARTRSALSAQRALLGYAGAPTPGSGYLARSKSIAL